VQEWVEGAGSTASIFCLLFYCDGAAGKPLAQSSPGRKLTAYPPGVGSTATCIAAPRQQAQLRGTDRAAERAPSDFAGMGRAWNFKRKRDIQGEFRHHRTHRRAHRLAGRNRRTPVGGQYSDGRAGFRSRSAGRLPAACGVENVAWRTSFKHRAPMGLAPMPVSGSSTATGRAADPMPGVIFLTRSSRSAVLSSVVFSGRILRQPRPHRSFPHGSRRSAA